MMEDKAPVAEAETETAGIADILADSPSPVAEKVAPEPEGAAPAAQAEVKPEAKPEAEQPFWFRKQLEKERKARQAAEREAEQLRQQRPEPQLPDPRQDPMSYFEARRLEDKVERSEDRFVDKHGEQEFEAVKEWLATRPDIEAWAVQQRHPWGSAFQQYQREKLSAEIGEDPNAWREKERDRIRAEVQAEFQSAPPMGRPAPTIPAPASGQRSAAPRGGAGFAGPTPLGDILQR